MDDYIEKHLDARRQQMLVNEQRREKHRPVAMALRDPMQAPDVIASAQKYVSLWREKCLCSIDYIEAWDRLLKHPNKAADALEDSSLNGIQLRQNSPFVAVVRKFMTASSAH